MTTETGPDRAATRRAQNSNGKALSTSYHSRNGNQVDSDARSSENLNPPVYNNTDAGNAKRFVDQHGQNVLYCHSTGQLLTWDGKRFARDSAGEVKEMAKATALSVYGEAENAPSRSERESLAKWALKSEGRDRINAMIDLAKSDPRIRVDAADLDADPLLLNCANGTLDLRIGELREHRREDNLTKLCPHEYDGNASCPQFLKFLNEILAENSQLIGFVQRFLGYSLVGEVKEHILLIFYGGGSNGKSTLLETWRELLGGDYAMTAPRGLMTASKNPRHPTELADLQGMRLVVLDETEDGDYLSESLVKSLTGGNVIRARRMNKDFYEFPPSHTPVLATNHRPKVRGTDHAIWRRLKFVPFTVTIPDAQQDKYLKDKLKSEFPGILAWMVAGCLDWQQNGLGEPSEVASATNEYRSDCDEIGSFLREYCVIDPNERVQSSRLYEAYKTWAVRSGVSYESQRDFSSRLKERGFNSSKSNGVMVFRGLGLKPQGVSQQERNDGGETNEVEF